MSNITGPISINTQIKSIIGYEDYNYTSQPFEIRRLINHQVIKELKSLEQHRIAAQNPDGGVTIVSEWVSGSSINNRIRDLENATI